jgi:hypothetical protein
MLEHIGSCIYGSNICIDLFPREKEAGMLSMGHVTSPSLLIPPKTNGWKQVGHCSSDCTKNLDDEAITIFNINLHAHLSGKNSGSYIFLI